MGLVVVGAMAGGFIMYHKNTTPYDTMAKIIEINQINVAKRKNGQLIGDMPKEFMESTKKLRISQIEFAREHLIKLSKPLIICGSWERVKVYKDASNDIPPNVDLVVIVMRFDSDQPIIDQLVNQYFFPYIETEKKKYTNMIRPNIIRTKFNYEYLINFLIKINETQLTTFIFDLTISPDKNKNDLMMKQLLNIVDMFSEIKVNSVILVVPIDTTELGESIDTKQSINLIKLNKDIDYDDEKYDFVRTFY